jgi:signal transduction histidine kinase
MAVLIAMELFTLWFAISTLSSVRAFVGGEGLWSKAQKDAVYHLRKYYRTNSEEEYRQFQEFMKVPLGDHKTRLELMKKEPDINIARQGFLEGRNDPKDIDGMIKLFRRFSSVSYISRAISIWIQADTALAPLVSIGEQLHAEVISPSPDQIKIEQLLKQIDIINEKLTVLEDNFSYTLGEGSRWLENLILKLLFAVALTVEISGLILTISVSRGIQKGLNEIIRVSKRIAKGDFSSKAKAFSGDEIGVLANSFNHMAEELGKANESLKNYAQRLERSNESLRQFAYVASHDLKEPLRKINTFSSRLEDEYQPSIDERGKLYLNKIGNASMRMQKLIDDILNFSHLNSSEFSFAKTDLNAVLKQVLTDMEVVIEKNNVQINASQLPIIDANVSQMGQLFQNIISNSIKFKKPDVNPHIEISVEESKGSGLLSQSHLNNHYNFPLLQNGSSLEKEKFIKIKFKDNGIGFDQAYASRIFEVFQRLNSKDEYEGTGIGLAICKRIVDIHHGIITTNSEPDAGATFIVILPSSQENFREDLKI